ncbi:MAG: carboxypeptidase-like regulatory domain-containing protein [Bryobacteraceae bacterium]|jgi:hypothetical protein
MARLAAAMSASWLALAGAGGAAAQSLMGELRGSIVDSHGRPLPGAAVSIAGAPAAFQVKARANAAAEFRVVLPYGLYRIGRTSVYVPPLGSVCVRASGDASVVAQLPCGTEATRPQNPDRSDTYGADALLDLLHPSSVSSPLDLAGNGSRPDSLVSQNGLSWTDVNRTYQGSDIGDPYQPGRALFAVDLASVEELTVRDGLELGDARAFGSQMAGFAAGFAARWHGALATANTGGFLASNNLPPPGERGLVQQAGFDRWYTRTHAEASGNLGRRVALDIAASGQWASESAPQAAPGSGVGSRQLFANAGARIVSSSRDLLEIRASEATASLSNYGWPAGIEAYYGRALGPAPPQTAGFPGLAENDGAHFLQGGWTRQAAGGIFDARLDWTGAHLTTSGAMNGVSRIDLVTGTATGAPPLATRGERNRESLRAGYQRQSLAVTGEWSRAESRNRFLTPAGTLLTANGQLAYIVDWNTPQASRAAIQSGSISAREQVAVAPWLALDGAAVADRTAGGPIAWTNLSPRVGFVVLPPWLRALTLRGGYARLYAPLSGRDLDFANPASLGGRQYLWDGSGAGQLVAVFGGPYSSLDSALRRPYADEIDAGLQAELPRAIAAGLQYFRRDEKRRMAAIDTGVGAADYTSVVIDDPGPDGVAGTFDDQKLTVYAQNPASFGQDRYLLTNPAGLRELDEGIVAEAGQTWRWYGWHASFMAVKSYGPANAGNAPIENDPGVIGSLFLDPNLGINTAGRAYFDRAYVGKLQFAVRLPRWLGSIECANTVNYLDGLPFARLLLVTGLPQGPIVVDTTPRGSPGGNRSQHVLNWNLRLSRGFGLMTGSARVSVDVLNVANAAARIEEIDVTGLTFNQRLPAVLQPARFARLGLEWRR